jgi:ABC-type glutathione transport system ATPase component
MMRKTGASIPRDSKLSLREIKKSFSKDGSSLAVLLDISLFARQGEFISILGPSGCGKSTLFNVVVGLIQRDGGIISVEYREVESGKVATRFITAIDEAIRFTKRYPEEALKVYFQGNPDVRKDLDARTFKETLPVFPTTQAQSLEKWKGFADFALERGLIRKRSEPETLFENVLR